MTKRAGKRKNRKPVELQGKTTPPKKQSRRRVTRHGARGSKISYEDGTENLPVSMVDGDGLDPVESVRLEARSIAQGWLLDGDETVQQLRQAVMLRMMRIASKSPDEKTAVMAFRAVSQGELAQQRIKLGQLWKTDLPAQISVGVQVGGSVQEPAEETRRVPVHEVVRDLLEIDEGKFGLMGLQVPSGNCPASDGVSSGK